jgi:hypothetical protein
LAGQAIFPNWQGQRRQSPFVNTATRLLLVRHGAVANSWSERIYGRLDVPLSPAGEAEARTIAAALSKAAGGIHRGLAEGTARPGAPG